MQYKPKNYTLFNVNISNNINVKKNALVLSGCKLIMTENIKYSELDENNFFCLNSNDYGHGGMNIEICFDNIFEEPYFQFFLNCVSIRINNKNFFKSNMLLMNKQKVYTKINKNGKLSITIRYHFKSTEESKIIKDCDSILIDGFIALNKKNNVYGFMCNVEESERIWTLSEGNTYKIFKKATIDSLTF